MSLNTVFDQPPIPEFGTIDTWCLLSGMGRRASYEELGRGNLKAVKSGTRTLIKIREGLVYMHSLPPAEIKASKPSVATPSVAT